MTTAVPLSSISTVRLASFVSDRVFDAHAHVWSDQKNDRRHADRMIEPI